MIKVRTEQSDDHSQVHDVLKNAFGRDEEASLVERLRKSKDFISELSLVVIDEGSVLGHILFTKIVISDSKATGVLALAPMAVQQKHQNIGIGKLLVRSGLSTAADLDYRAVVVLGHKNYYPKFGFQQASAWDIECPFPVSDEIWMALELVPDALMGCGGTVQ